MTFNETLGDQPFLPDNMTSWNSSNFTDLAFVSPFSILFYRSIFIVIYSVIISVCIIGNVLVLFVTTNSARMKTRTYFFLANLAAADLCVGVLCILPNLLMFLYPGWLLGQVMCKVYYFTESFSFCASVLLLAVIALERYVAVMHPLKARSLFTRCRMQIMQVIIWTVAACYNIPLLIIFDTHTAGDTAFCFSANRDIIDMRSYYTINFILWYAIPLFIMCFVYILIAWTLWHSDSIFGYSSTSTDISANGSSPKLVTTGGGNRSKVESSSSGASSSGYSDGGGSRQGVLRLGSTLEDRMINSTCFCCRGELENSSGEEVRSDLNSRSRFAYSDNGSMSGNRRAQNNSDSTCWSWPHSASHQEAYARNELSNSNCRSTPPKIRSNFSNCVESYELACFNPNCRQLHHRHGYPIHNFTHNNQRFRHHFNMSKKDGVTPTLPSTRRMSMSLRVLSSRRKVVRLLVVVMLTFAVCVLPHHVRLLMHYWDIYPESSFESTFFPPIAFICLYLNSALNPVLYSLFSQSFRRSLKECLRKPWHKWKSFISMREILQIRRHQRVLKMTTV